MEALTLVAARAAGLAGVICLATWPLAQTRGLILGMQTAMGLGFALHCALLGLSAAAAISVLGAAQSVAAIGTDRWPWLSRIGHALVPVIPAAALWFWAGPVSPGGPAGAPGRPRPDLAACTRV